MLLSRGRTGPQSGEFCSGVVQLEERGSHNPEVTGSNPVAATNEIKGDNVLIPSKQKHRTGGKAARHSYRTRTGPHCCTKACCKKRQLPYVREAETCTTRRTLASNLKSERIARKRDSGASMVQNTRIGHCALWRSDVATWVGTHFRSLISDSGVAARRSVARFDSSGSLGRVRGSTPRSSPGGQVGSIPARNPESEMNDSERSRAVKTSKKLARPPVKPKK